MARGPVLTGTGRLGPDTLLRFLGTLPHGRRPRGESTCYVALSGGADSTVLAALLAGAAPRLPGRAAAVHVHHGFAGTSDRFEAHCRGLCERLDLPLEVLPVTPDFESGRGPEAELRHCRYEALERVLGPADLLLLAHQLEDQAETVLLHLLRGSGVEGLAGMPAWRPLGEGTLARPLLGWPRHTIEASLRDQDLPWVEDPSNEDRGLDRNYLRHEILPRLRRRWPQTDRALGRAAGLVRESTELLAAWAERQLATAIDEPDRLRLGRLEAPGSAGLRAVLRAWVRAEGLAPIPAARLEEFCQQLDGAREDSAPLLRWEGHGLRLYRDRLWLERDYREARALDVPWNGSDILDLGQTAGSLELVAASPEKTPVRDPRPTWRVRSRQAGDRFRRSAESTPRKVKAILQQAGLPPWLRESVPLLCADREILALGDWLLAAELAQWLERRGLALRWRPGNAHLAHWRARRTRGHGRGSRS